jgi:MFS family permease
VDGFAQATQNIAQGFSGAVSDRLQKRKLIALFGYLLAALAEPVMGLATMWQTLLGARLLDRLGAGMRSAPRDALVAASVDEHDRSRAFGLEGLGDNAGAFLGPLVALFLLYAVHVDLRSVFYLALIPGLLAFLMVLLVTERHVTVAAKARIDTDLRRLPTRYWKYLLATALFGAGNSSNAFLILQTRDVGVSLKATILIYAAFNLVAALISYPAGALSDRSGRRNLLFAATVFFATYLGFALTRNVALIGALFVLYGLYQGMFRAVGKALAADLAPQHLRASGVGWYSATVGLLQLVASVIAVGPKSATPPCSFLAPSSRPLAASACSFWCEGTSGQEKNGNKGAGAAAIIYPGKNKHVWEALAETGPRQAGTGGARNRTGTRLCEVSK